MQKLQKSVHSQAQKQFCALLAQARKRAGMTQAQLARRLGKPQSFVAKVEAGERRVDVIEFLAIAAALGRDPAQLVKALVRRIPDEARRALARGGPRGGKG